MIFNQITFHTLIQMLIISDYCDDNYVTVSVSRHYIYLTHIFLDFNAMLLRCKLHGWMPSFNWIVNNKIICASKFQNFLNEHDSPAINVLSFPCVIMTVIVQSARLRIVNNVTRMARVPGVSMVQHSTMEIAEVGWNGTQWSGIIWIILHIISTGNLLISQWTCVYGQKKLGINNNAGACPTVLQTVPALTKRDPYCLTLTFNVNFNLWLKFIQFWVFLHRNSSPVQAIITKLGPEMHLSIVKSPINFGLD